MNQVIIYTNEIGGVAVCFPTGELPIEVVQQRDIPKGVESFIVTKDSLPPCFDYAMAWEQSNGVVTVNIAKAREVAKEKLRFDRKELFANLDVAFQRAMETGADTSAIVAEKQRLRDITNLPDSCNTIEELRALSV
jgi:hypothetical protein